MKVLVGIVGGRFLHRDIKQELFSILVAHELELPLSDGGRIHVALIQVAVWGTVVEAMAYLNLTSFDVNGGGTFDAADVAAIDALLPPLVLQVSKGADLDFGWNSKGHLKEYDLVSSTDLETPILTWPIYDDGTASVFSNMIAAAATTATLSDVQASGPERFFGLIERDSGARLLHVADGSFEDPPPGFNASWGSMHASWNDGVITQFEVVRSDAHDGEWKALFLNYCIVRLISVH